MGDLSKWPDNNSDKRNFVKNMAVIIKAKLEANGNDFSKLTFDDFSDPAFWGPTWNGYEQYFTSCGYTRDDLDELIIDSVYAGQHKAYDLGYNGGAFMRNGDKPFSMSYVRDIMTSSRQASVEQPVEKPAEQSNQKPPEQGNPKLPEQGNQKPPEQGNPKPPEQGNPKPPEQGNPKPLEQGNQKLAEQGNENSDDASEDQEIEQTSVNTDKDKTDKQETEQVAANADKDKTKKQEAEQAAQAEAEASKKKNKRDETDEAEAQKQAGPKLGSELSGLRDMGALSDNEYRCGMALGQIMTMSVKNAPVVRALLDPINYLTTSQRSSLYGKHVARMLEKELKRSQKLDAEIERLYTDIKERGVRRADRIQNGEKVDLEKEAVKKSDKKPQEQKDGSESGKSGEKRSVLSWLGDKIHRSSGKDDVKNEPEETVNQPEAGEDTVSGEEGKAKKFGKAALTAVQTGAAGLAGCLTGVTLGIWNKAKNIGDVIRRTPAYQTFVQFAPVMWLKDTAHKISDSIKEARESHRAAGDHDCTKEGNEVTFVSNTDPCPEKLPLDKEFVKSLETVVKYFNAKGFSIQIVQNEPEKVAEATHETAAPTVEAELNVEPETTEEPAPERPLPVDESTVTAKKGPDGPQEAQDGHEGQDTASKPETAVEGSDGPQKTPNAVDGRDTASKPETAVEGSDGPQEGRDGHEGQDTVPVAETAVEGPEEPQDADSETDLSVNAGKALRRGTSDKTDHKDTPVSHTMAELNRRAAEMNNDTDAKDDKENQGLNGIV